MKLLKRVSPSGWSVVLVMSVALAHAAPAATLVWDGDTAVAGLQEGGGNWETSATNRWYDASTTSYRAWNDATFDTAKFGQASTSAAHTVTLTTPITVGGLEFGSVGTGEYVISGTTANRLTLVGANPTIAMNHTKATLSLGLSGTQGFTLTGAASQVLYLSGSVANDYTGTTRISGGELRLNKTAGVTAVADDIVIQGGTLRWGAANQVSDQASITLNSGTLWLNGQTETIKNLTLNGGENNGGSSSNGGTFTVTDTLTVNATSGALGLNSATKWSAGKLVMNGTVAGATGLSITGNSTGTMSTFTVGAGGLEMNSRHIVLNTGSNDGQGNPIAGVKGSQILLNGDAKFTGQVMIQKNGNNVGPAQVNLGDSTRTFEVALLPTEGAAVSDAKVGVSIVGTGGLTKTGAGVLTLGAVAGSTDANTYTGMTTISAGTLKLAKSANVDAIAGDVTVQTGGVLDWTASHQLKDTSSVYLTGGYLSIKTFNESFANLYQSAGGVNLNGNSVSADVTVTGEIVLTGGEAVILNSSGQWTVNRFEATASKTGSVLGFNGNSADRMNRVAVGSGGITLTHNQSINLAKGTTVGVYGSELVLRGDFVTSGTVAVNVSSPQANGVAQINLDGGQRIFRMTAGSTTTIHASVVSTTVTPTGAAAVASAGGIIKTGAGTLVLSNANSYSGNTRVEGGVLRLSSTGSLSATPRITVFNGAAFDVTAITAGYTLAQGKTLEGGGEVRGAFTLASAATLAPGTVGLDVTQTLAFSAGLQLLTGSNTFLELGSGGDHDALSIGGNFLQESGAKILVSSNGFTPTAGATYQLFEIAGTATFSSNFGSLLRSGSEDNGTDFDLPDITSSGLFWDVSQLRTLGVISIVPEPSKGGFLLAGLIGFLVRRSRVRK